MVNINFNLKERQLQIDLATMPEACDGVLLSLPNGQHLQHHFNGAGTAGPTINLDQLSESIAQFVNHLEFNEDRRENTLKNYRNRLRQFLDWLKINSACNPAEGLTWQIYYHSLKKRDLSVYTRKGHYHILNRFGKWLIKQGHLRSHPLADITPPTLPKEVLPKAIFRDHIKAMLAAAREPRERALLLFFRDTGCRAAEAISLTWGKVQLEEGTVRVPGKGDKERTLYLKPISRKAMDKYRATVPHKKGDAVWWGRQGPLNYDGVYKIFKRLATEVGIGDDIFNPHAWRHAFGRDTTIAGIPTAQLQDLMGHSSIEVTKIYAQFNEAELQAAHARYSPVDHDFDNPASAI